MSPRPSAAPRARASRRRSASRDARTASSSSGRRRAHRQAGEGLGEGPDCLDLLGLLRGVEHQHALDLGHAGQAREGLVLGLQLREGPRGGEGGDPRAAGLGEDALLPGHGFHALGLKLEQVVLEAHAGRAPERERRAGHRADQDGLAMGHDALEPLRRRRRPAARGGAERARARAPVDERQQGGEERDHGDEGQEDGDARHDAELADPLKRGQDEHQEGPGRGDGAQHHAGPGAERGGLERPRHAGAQRALLLVAEEEVDAVVDADPDHDAR